MTRVDDTFIKELVDEVKHVENLFAFAEAFEDKMVGIKLINRSGKKIFHTWPERILGSKSSE